MTQITTIQWCDHWPRARHPGVWSEVGLRKHHYKQSYWRWWNSSWVISSPKRWCCTQYAIWSLVPLPFLNPSWTSGSSWFTYCWSLTWRILSLTLLACEMSAAKLLHSICQQIWKTQQWPQDWKRSVFIPIPKKGNAKECSNYHTVALTWTWNRLFQNWERSTSRLYTVTLLI